ncbi:MAG: radical SAM/SPASM domain-containing protein [Rivularia sp. (in: cyanobacteria)]
MNQQNKESARVYVKTFHQALGILITMKCPIECGHCFIDSSPKRQEIIDSDLIISRLHEIGQQGKIKQLIITGGEPFAVGEILKNIVRIAADYKINTLVQSSAFWASTLERSISFLKQFPGITNLCISADEYHENFVPLESVKNALLAALECDIIPELSLRVWDMEKDPFLTKIYDILGKDLLEHVNIDFERIKVVGRANNLSVPDIAVKKIEESFPEGACDFAHQPSIDCDGKVLACCNTTRARQNKALQLGNLNEQSFPEISHQAEQNLILQALRVWGPKRLAEIAIARGMEHKLKGIYPQGNICALCDDLLSQPEIITLLTSVLDTPEMREEIILARLLRYGEIPVNADWEVLC